MSNTGLLRQSSAPAAPAGVATTSGPNPAKKAAVTPKSSPSKQPAARRKSAAKAKSSDTDTANKSAEKWPAEDDYKLCVNMLQASDLVTVHQCVKFSHPYLLEEVRDRWRLLLTDATSSRLSNAVMSCLSTGQKLRLTRKLLWSQEEEVLLVGLAQKDKDATPSLAKFHELLNKHRTIFAPCRTAVSLQRHYHKMRLHGHLAPHVPKPPAEGDAPEFAEVHEEVVRTVDEGKAGTAPSAALRRELERMDQKEKTKIRMLEAQLEAWRNSGVHALGMETLVDMCPLPTDHQHQFEPQSLAVIIGPDNFAFQMTYKEIVIGRQSSEGDVDIDLSIFPHTSAVSRWHCTIKLKHDSFFYCYNKGKRPVFLNGVRISTNGKRQMGYESLLQICGVDLRFIANIPLLHDLFST